MLSALQAIEHNQNIFWLLCAMKVCSPNVTIKKQKKTQQLEDILMDKVCLCFFFLLIL
jgi:hypothetical protein